MGSIHLIRHGQASWGADDYDLLSPLGHQQAIALGASWEASNWFPTHAIAGSMKRHAQTAVEAIDASGQGDGYDIDDGWNEFDHVGVAASHDPDAMKHDAKKFQATLNEALALWRVGEGDFSETYRAFVDRVMAAFERCKAHAGSGQSVAVFTSGGPIATVMSHVLAGDDSLFQTLNNVVINAGVTTLIVGQSGTNLLAFNEHTHLPRSMVSYR